MAQVRIKTEDINHRNTASNKINILSYQRYVTIAAVAARCISIDYYTKFKFECWSSCLNKRNNYSPISSSIIIKQPPYWPCRPSTIPKTSPCSSFSTIKKLPSMLYASIYKDLYSSQAAQTWGTTGVAGCNWWPELAWNFLLLLIPVVKSGVVRHH